VNIACGALALRGAPSYLHDMANTFSSQWIPGSSETRQAALARLDRLAQLFDTAFLVPGTNIRFGVEAIMRLVPGIGDAAASALSCYLLYEAHRLGVPSHIFARMLLNVAIEGAVGTVPFLGDAFDVAFRANRRNVRILREYFEQAGGV
jgi:uncharacterized protein DUF4112